MSKCLPLEMKEIRQREKKAQTVEVTWLMKTNPSLAKSATWSQSAFYTRTVWNLTPQIGIYRNTNPGITLSCSQNSPSFLTPDPEDTCAKTKEQNTWFVFLETNNKTIFLFFFIPFPTQLKIKSIFIKTKSNNISCAFLILNPLIIMAPLTQQSAEAVALSTTPGWEQKEAMRNSKSFSGSDNFSLFIFWVGSLY